MKRQTILIVLALTLTLLSGCADKQQKETDNATATENSVADASETEKKGEEKAQEVITLKEKGEINCSLPEGFVEYEDEKGLYVCEEYPNEIACISYVIADFDGNKEEMSEAILKERLEKDMLDSYKENVDVNIVNYEEYQIDGSDAVKMEVSFRLMGADYEQIQLLVFDEEKQEEHILNYIQEAGEDWMDKFHNSVDTVSFSG